MSTVSEDYMAVNVDVTLGPNTQRACSNISITDDRFPENNETFRVTIPPRDDVNPGPDTQVTITDNGETFEKAIKIETS